MYSNTVIYSNDTLCDSVKRSISTYRDNFKNLSSELEKKVSQDEELKYFYWVHKDIIIGYGCLW